jgi:hypothetical protein
MWWTVFEVRGGIIGREEIMNCATLVALAQCGIDVSRETNVNPSASAQLKTVVTDLRPPPLLTKRVDLSCPAIDRVA